MSNLTNVEKRKFEQLLGMGTGYVLDFTNRSFAEVVFDRTGRNIYDVTAGWTVHARDNVNNNFQVSAVNAPQRIRAFLAYMANGFL